MSIVLDNTILSISYYEDPSPSIQIIGSNFNDGDDRHRYSAVVDRGCLRR